MNSLTGSLRASLDDIGRGLVLVLFEILIEQLAELVNLLAEVGSTSPGLLGVKELIGNIRARFWNYQLLATHTRTIASGEGKEWVNVPGKLKTS